MVTCGLREVDVTENPNPVTKSVAVTSKNDGTEKYLWCVLYGGFDKAI